MNRLLSSGQIKAAVELSENQVKYGVLKCPDCAAYCENACRRKKVDTPVSIRNLQIFIAQQIIPEVSGSEFHVGFPETVKAKTARRFESRIGKLLEGELEEWVKECPEDLKRYRDIPDSESAALESASCMHCDCRAAENCKLREIANDFSIKDPKGKLVNSPIRKKININTGLVFENAKCIKCGLCVRLCETYKDGPTLSFINRGFVGIISEPLTEEFNNILKTKSKEVIEICPTGALSQKNPPTPLKGG
jgi:succinate dehydrogenase/fumarate reductase-like Fe-S protein